MSAMSARAAAAADVASGEPARRTIDGPRLRALLEDMLSDHAQQVRRMTEVVALEHASLRQCQELYELVTGRRAPEWELRTSLVRAERTEAAG